MTQREKMLGGAVATVGLLWFGTQGLIRYRSAMERNVNQQIEAERALSEAKAAINRGQHARRQLHKWALRSLPTDAEIAESLYQDWLRGQLTDAGLQVTQLNDRTGNDRNSQFGELSFEIRCEGPLADLAKFLYQFYSAAHLHRISSATITGGDGGQKLAISMTVDAMILPTCQRTDRLAEGQQQTLPASLDEYRSRIVDRNLFAAYAPKPADGAGGGMSDAAAAAAKITGMTYGLGGWIMSVHAGESTDLQFFQQGDSLEFGSFKGKVVEIDGRRAIVETEKGRMEVRLGQSFAEATALQAPAA
ncbi:MAG: hypothetical protein IT424_00225 [Pirellulales bacterium]|nr:hypothetical protein [Pirellulales bacterium]